MLRMRVIQFKTEATKQAFAESQRTRRGPSH
jgi:hypothetical protein